MKKINIIAAAAAVGAVLTSGCSTLKSEEEKPLRVLMIGNSFSVCALQHMPAVAESPEPLKVTHALADRSATALTCWVSTTPPSTTVWTSK